MSLPALFPTVAAGEVRLAKRKLGGLSGVFRGMSTSISVPVRVSDKGRGDADCCQHQEKATLTWDKRQNLVQHRQQRSNHQRLRCGTFIGVVEATIKDPGRKPLQDMI